LYFSWDRKKEDEAELGNLDNRYPALFEVRRAIWPNDEHAFDSGKNSQYIAGFLDHVVREDFKKFITTVENESQSKPTVIDQRVNHKGHPTEISKDLLDSTDTLLILSLDHKIHEVSPTDNEVTLLKAFLTDETKCLFCCPHHDVGSEDQVAEQAHHRDSLVPGIQKIGHFALKVLEGIGLPVENKYGLRPALVNGEPAPLDIARSEDEHKMLEGVTNFNRHDHLPHFERRPESLGKLSVLARQRIDPAAGQHPFTDKGAWEFNAFLASKPDDTRKGTVYICDATLWSAAFGGIPSLERLWKNVATKPKVQASSS
ncbi:MAG: hypothetical protein MN733_12840, partial [Nitrososphaera sp.]|nr:hypothetical protein [Nitrososphaera sp.]